MQKSFSREWCMDTVASAVSNLWIFAAVSIAHAFTRLTFRITIRQHTLNNSLKHVRCEGEHAFGATVSDYYTTAMHELVDSAFVFRPDVTRFSLSFFPFKQQQSDPKPCFENLRCSKDRSGIICLDEGYQGLDDGHAHAAPGQGQKVGARSGKGNQGCRRNGNGEQEQR
jgi:hypothetical protein